MHGFYKRGDGDVVVLPANPDDKPVYEAKGFEYLGEAPDPGTSTAEDRAAAWAKVKKGK